MHSYSLFLVLSYNIKKKDQSPPVEESIRVVRMGDFFILELLGSICVISFKDFLGYSIAYAHAARPRF